MHLHAVQFPNVDKQPRNKALHFFIPFLVALGVLWGFWLWSIRSPRIVASAVAPDGTELRVVQTCNWSTTEVYYRKPGGRWGWFYYDHEDGYRDSGKAEVDAAAQRSHIKRGGRITAAFEWESEAFHLMRSDMPHRTSLGADAWRAPPAEAR